jgi:uncharacterized protein
MKAAKIWANLAVTDLKRTADFYTKLGFKSNMTQPSNDLTSFSFGKDDFIVHFFKQEILEKAMGGKAADLNQGNEIIFTLSAQSDEEVRQWAIDAKEAGGKVIREASHDENGYYYCVFADPEGHKFNVLSVGSKM